MSLQIWLPLINDTKNRGLNTIQFINSSATNVSGGKLGNCYQFVAKTGNGLYNQTDNIKYMNEHINHHSFSFCAWVKSSSADTCVCSFSFGLSLFIGDYIRLRLYNLTRTITCLSDDGCGTTDGKWHHVAGTYDTNTNIIAVYRDGVCVGMTRYTSGETYASSWANIILVGRDPNDSSQTDHYFYNGLMNDFRAYDNSLSPAEVKDISKGLYLHYKLSGKCGDGDNMINGTNFNGVPARVDITNTSGEQGLVYTPNTPVVSDYTYTVSARLRGTSGVNIYRLNTGGNEVTMIASKSDLSETEFRPFYITFKTPSSRTTNQIYVCSIYHVSQVGEWFEIEPDSLKLEMGSSPTAWTPSYADMGETGNVEYDCSGYRLDGVRVGSLQTDSDSPRYNSCMYIPKLTAWGLVGVHRDSLPAPADLFTASIWMKASGDSGSVGSGYQTVLDYGSCFIEISVTPSNGSLRAGAYIVSPQGSGNRYVENCTNPSVYDGKWHLLVLTFDGTYLRRYVDALQYESTTVTAGSTPVESANTFTVGYIVGGTYQANNVYLSDARMYCTALSQQDITELYNTPAKISNTGALLTYEISEA